MTDDQSAETNAGAGQMILHVKVEDLIKQALQSQLNDLTPDQRSRVERARAFAKETSKVVITSLLFDPCVAQEAKEAACPQQSAPGSSCSKRL